MELRYIELLLYIQNQVPASIDFYAEVAVLSYTERCEVGGKDLIVDRVLLVDGWLEISETLHHDPAGPAEETRPYSVISIPADSYLGVTGL